VRRCGRRGAWSNADPRPSLDIHCVASMRNVKSRGCGPTPIRTRSPLSSGFKRGVGDGVSDGGLRSGDQGFSIASDSPMTMIWKRVRPRIASILWTTSPLRRMGRSGGLILRRSGNGPNAPPSPPIRIPRSRCPLRPDRDCGKCGRIVVGIESPSQRIPCTSTSDCPCGGRSSVNPLRIADLELCP
jgi:hypothetical protein